MTSRFGSLVPAVVLAACLAVEVAAQPPAPDSAVGVLRSIAVLPDDADAGAVRREISAFVAVADDLTDAPETELLDAIGRLRRLARRSRPATQVYYEYYVAWVWTGRGRLDLAEQALRSVDERFPDEPYGRDRRDELLAGIYHEQGENARALELLAAMQARWEGGEATTGPARDAALAAVHGLRGEILAGNGLLVDAGKELDREWQLARRSEDDQAIHNALRRQIDFHLGSGDLPGARRAIGELTHRVPESAGEQALYRGTLLFLEARRDSVHDPERYRQLLRDATQALFEAASSPDLDRASVGTAQLKLLEIELLRGHLDQAEDWARQYRADFGVPADRPDRLAAMRVPFHTLVGLLDVARGAAAADLRRDAAEVERGYRRLLDDWRALGVRPGGVGVLHDEQRRLVLGALVSLTLALAEREGREDGPARALDFVLEAQALNTLARERGAGVCTVADVRRELLQPGCGILVYLPTRHGTHLFSVDDDGTRQVLLDPRAVLVRDTERLAELLAVDPRDAARDPQMVRRMSYWSRAVGERLLPAQVAARVATWRGVTVVGAEMLDHVPFEVLPAAAGAGRLLGEALAVDNLSSLPLGVYLARHRPHRSGPLELLLLACTGVAPRVAADKEIEAMPFPTADAGRAFVDRFGSHARCRIDGQVTRASVLAEDLASADVVHLIAHLVRRPGVELQTGLVTADRPVWHGDLLAKPSAGLVVLGAGASGRSADRIGDSPLITNLGGAFLSTGAHTVILPRTAVSLRGHVAFSRELYRALQGGASPAGAARAARAALARPDDPGRYYRGTVQVFGAGQLPLR